jgi:hypothetical protein
MLESVSDAAKEFAHIHNIEATQRIPTSALTGSIPNHTEEIKMETFETEEQQQPRSEYPADRIVIDIFELLQDMMTIGFSFTTYWRSNCVGEPLLSIDLWESENENNRFGVFDHENPEPNAIYPILHGCTSGRASYNETHTGSLHGLYNRLWDIYTKRKSETAIPDVCPF